ncbi:hypothetical protein QR680_008182 [Steinernema hermaphroditum]|uniref:Uncharacterized protein n=1 Tax=Steinernema hermaphroditum TaxID=289476 RepID=A0AA39M7N5_9BILA|nr:hypothetical protein QR680_008182 [Steinernema hermaphroditum]
MIRCRNMLYQLVNSVTENAFLLFDYFIQFEREEGTLEDLEKALAEVNCQARRLERLRMRRVTYAVQFLNEESATEVAVNAMR